MKSQIHSKLLACTTTAVLSISSAFAGESAKSIQAAANQSVIEPAVSGINGKIDVNYGAVNNSYTRGTAGSVSLPLGQSYGLQLDALYQHGMETDIYGLGGHIFTRRPDKGMLGLAFGGNESTDFTDLLVGVEGEYYFSKITLGGFVGYNNFDSHIIPTFSTNLATKTNFVAGRIYAAIYPMDNLMLRLEYQNRFERNFFVAHLEYQTPVRGVALFLDGGLGDNSYSHLMGGVRIYFGGNKSLKDRHRKDDPSNINSAIINSATGAISSPVKASNGGGGGIPPV